MNDRKTILAQIRKEREAREKGERPWTQRHHLMVDGRVPGHIRIPSPMRAPKKSREPGDNGSKIKLE